jgi:hypothetical protein
VTFKEPAWQVDILKLCLLQFDLGPVRFAFLGEHWDAVVFARQGDLAGGVGVAT